MKKLLLLTLAVSVGMASTYALAQATGQAAPQAGHNKMMARMDANGDGAISKDEAAKFPRLAAKFEQIDGNKDGKLSTDELAAWRKAAMGTDGGMGGHGAGYKDPEDMTTRHAQRRDACFSKADANKDGQLSRDEFNKMGEVCGMRHGGMRHGDKRQMPPAPPAPPAAPVAPVKK